MALLPVSDALARILDGVALTPAEEIELLDAAGRVLANDLPARLTQPPFDASAMDGYAVQSADVARLPATLTVIGEAAAGRGFRGRLEAGQAVRIFTGAPLPEGADAIIIQENTCAEGTRVIVTEGKPDPAHIRRKGGDFAEGEVLLYSGRRLDARALALAAAAGHGALPVRRKPVVAILATGDELVPPGTRPGPDQIVSSNPAGLAALVSSAGGTVLHLGIARDNRASLAAKIDEARDADVLVTIAGASVGDHDLVAPALKDAGMTLDFWKIAMRPGKPMLFGHRGTQRVLGLPGNPVSSLITGRVFLVPLVQRLLGLAETAAPSRMARLTHALEANGPRTHYMRAMLTHSPEEGGLVTAIGDQDSSLISVLARSNALIVRDAAAPAVAAGTQVAVLALDF
jgi:molybdopterin molybdotransferase